MYMQACTFIDVHFYFNYKYNQKHKATIIYITNMKHTSNGY